MRAVFFLILFTTLFVFRVEVQSETSTQAIPLVRPDSTRASVVSKKPSDDVVPISPPDNRSLQEKIIDFMKSLLEEKPEPIDESLLRDPL